MLYMSHIYRLKYCRQELKTNGGGDGKLQDESAMALCVGTYLNKPDFFFLHFEHIRLYLLSNFSPFPLETH